MKRATNKTEHRMAPPNLRASQARVYQMFRLYGDITDAQLIEYLHSMEKGAGLKVMSPSGARTRRKELVDKGLIRDTGRNAIVEGRSVTVWGLVPHV